MLILMGWMAVITLLFYWVVVMHELGHALAAKFLGYKILQFQIGPKNFSLSWRIAGIYCCFGFPPFWGNCSSGNPKDDRSEKRKLTDRIVIACAGPLLSSASLALLCIALTHSPYFPTFRYFIAGFALLELANLLPPANDGKTIQSLVKKYRSLSR